MTHPDIAALFDLLDQWRHLPSYRLEPRADAVFGLFLPHALDRHLASRGTLAQPSLPTARRHRRNRYGAVRFFAPAMARLFPIGPSTSIADRCSRPPRGSSICL